MMLSIYKNTLRRYSAVTIFLFLIGFVWQSPALAKKPPLDEGGALYAAAMSAEDNTLIFNGIEKLKLSRCCKPPKLALEIAMKIVDTEVWEITHINGEELVDLTMVLDPDPDDNPLTDDATYVPDPIIGRYLPKNKRRTILSFYDTDEEAQFLALVEEWATEEAIANGNITEEESVCLDYKKAKLDVQAKPKKDGSFKTRLQFKFSLRRADCSLGKGKGNGSPKLGSGVYMMKGKGFVAAPEPEVVSP